MQKAEERHYFLWLKAMLLSHFTHHVALIFILNSHIFLKLILRLCQFLAVKCYSAWFIGGSQKEQGKDPQNG